MIRRGDVHAQALPRPPRIGKCKISLSRAFAGQCVGMREVDDQVWLITFMDYDLGFFDRDEGRVEPASKPFAPEKVSTMSPE